MAKITSEGKIEGFIENIDTRLLSGVAGAYGVMHPASKTVYVGSSSDLASRTAGHKSGLRKGKHGNKNLQDRYNSVPEVTFSYLVTKNVDEARDLEQVILDENKGSPQLLNIATDARASGRGLPLPEWSDERRVAYSEHVKERWENPNYRTKIEAHLQSEENRARMSAWSKDYWEKNRETLAALHNSPETQQKHSEAIKTRWDDPSGRALLMEGVERTAALKRKPVEIDGVRYEGLGKAARATGIPLTTLARRVKSSSEQFEGYRYV
jgi:hypothetical protein